MIFWLVGFWQKVAPLLVPCVHNREEKKEKKSVKPVRNDVKFPEAYN